MSQHTDTRGFSPALIEALTNFLTYYPARRVSKNLRTVLFECLQSEGGMNDHIQSSLLDIEGIFDFLDVAAEEWRNTVE